MMEPSRTRTNAPEKRATPAKTASPICTARRGADLPAGAAMACCKCVILNFVPTFAYMTGFPSGVLISVCQELRTAAFTGSGSGMYSRPEATLSPLL